MSFRWSILKVRLVAPDFRGFIDHVDDVAFAGQALVGTIGLFESQSNLEIMSDFPPTIDELFETFEDLQEWDERYDFIIDLGRELPDFPTELQTAENIVDGCMSTVWLATTSPAPDVPLQIQADSDSIIVKGLIAVLLSFYNKMTPTQIVESDVSDYLTKLGLNQHLSPQRRNGLFSMIKRLKALAAKAC